MHNIAQCTFSFFFVQQMLVWIQIFDSLNTCIHELEIVFNFIGFSQFDGYSQL